MEIIITIIQTGNSTGWSQGMIFVFITASMIGAELRGLAGGMMAN